MTDVLVLLLVVLSILFLATVFLLRRLRKPKKQKEMIPLPDHLKDHLSQVPFYNRLSPGQQKHFESRVQQFLSGVRITGVNTEVTETDRILVAASAIIPIFNFDDWEYPNLNEVLLYPSNFNHEFEQEGSERNIMGMVGNGPMQDIMIISQHELRQGFLDQGGKTNTAIHEFVHLVDKTDGATDGIPENLILPSYVEPWLKLMHRKIMEIHQGDSDINPYGATNEAEFFAVVSEYFFERPELLARKHPELFEMLTKIFQSRK
ncbi:MAG TPA: M90 family metallopeptidase [Flavisolibacter sp.]